MPLFGVCFADELGAVYDGVDVATVVCWVQTFVYVCFHMN